MKKKFKYDIEKNGKIIESFNKWFLCDAILIFVSLGLTYLGYDLQLKKFTEFNACLFFYEIVFALILFGCNVFHAIMVRRAAKQEVKHEDK